MAIVLNASANTDIAASGSSIGVNINSSAGDLITCQWAFGNGLGQTLTSVADNKNSGNYVNIFSHVNNTNGTTSGISYFQNSAIGAPTTVTISLSAIAYIGLSCQSWHGFATTGNLIDKTQQQDLASTANPTSGGNLTPTNAGELVLVNLANESGTAPTAGSNYTLLQTSHPQSGQYSEYWIQTTATATNGPFTLASDSWTDQMVFISPIPVAAGGGGNSSWLTVNMNNSLRGVRH